MEFVTGLRYVHGGWSEEIFQGEEICGVVRGIWRNVSKGERGRKKARRVPRIKKRDHEAESMDAVSTRGKTNRLLFIPPLFPLLHAYFFMI